MRDNNPELQMLEDKVLELTDTISQLADENDHLKDVIASQQWDVTPFEKDYILDLVKELRSTIRILEIDNQALRDSRDMFQNRNAELLKTIGALKKKLQA
jgi:predicted  nucleic acid-binding Zn-ribbon protein